MPHVPLPAGPYSTRWGGGDGGVLGGEAQKAVSLFFPKSGEIGDLRNYDATGRGGLCPPRINLKMKNYGASIAGPSEWWFKKKGNVRLGEKTRGDLDQPGGKKKDRWESDQTGASLKWEMLQKIR